MDSRSSAWWTKEYQDEFPGWNVWRGVNCKYYGSRTRTTPPVVQRGDTPADLRDRMRSAEADHKSWWEAD